MTVLQICKDPIAAYIDVNLPDCCHRRAYRHNDIEYDNGVVGEP